MSNLKHFSSVFFLILFCISLFFSVIFIYNGYSDILRLGNIVFHDFAYYTFPINANENILFTSRWLYLSLSIISFSFLSYGMAKKKFIYLSFKSVTADISELSKKVFGLATGLSRADIIISLPFLLLITAIKLYFAVTHPLHTDEIASYDYFVSESFLSSVSFYPIPNNHILSNVISRFFYFLNQDPWFTMRIPVILISTLSTIFFFLALRKWSNLTIAIITTCLFCLSTNGLFYSFSGRGYFLYSLMAGIAFFSIIGITKDSKAKFYYITLFISSVIGFYTIPTFLYIYLPLFTYLVVHNLYERNLKSFYFVLLIGFATALSVLLLYSPVFFISGLDALINNSYVKPKTFEQFFANFIPYAEYIEQSIIGHPQGFNAFLAIPLLYLIIFALLRKKFLWIKLLGVPSLIIVLTPYLILAAQRVYTPDRVLFFKSFFFFLLFASVAYSILKALKVPEKLILVLSLFFLFYYVQLQIPQRQHLAAKSQNMKNNFDGTYKVVTEHQPSKVLINQAYYQLHFLHKTKLTGKPISLYSAPEEDMTYDYIIADRYEGKNTLPDLNNYTQVHQDDFVEVWKLEK